jgi:hypothetical protein
VRDLTNGSIKSLCFSIEKGNVYHAIEGEEPNGPIVVAVNNFNDQILFIKEFITISHLD